MNQAVFLVTTLNGVQKSRLTRRIKQMMDDGMQVKVILGLVNLYETRKARLLFSQTMSAKRLAQIDVLDLSEIFATKPGIPLQSDEQLKIDESLSEFEFKLEDGVKATRYVKAGDIKAEKIIDAEDGHLIRLTQFNEKHQPRRSANYNDNGDLISLSYFDDGQLKESQLINAKGESVFQFIDQGREVKLTFSLGKSSVIKLPTAVRLSKADVEADNASEPMDTIYQFDQELQDFQVLDNETFNQFKNVFQFYAAVLQLFDANETSYFIDMDDNITLSAYLPDQLIFNY
ncbi:hypothetical protein LOSG293_240120 [Secundilactobacillus oryzae JCM 18671]|uniref:Uncharacterized protein n=1 Tax=Secundilactobacillus oryzae JCM 18671 TaxID=1291743 RepID=A0A081BJS7_9LACO|nr:hypothetical protein [Secundilactobacillus oryzae]GAK48295.1 hypothetical protein LOSG293_240120 [Secundilactobacillus oryzae JCM 18671]